MSALETSAEPAVTREQLIGLARQIVREARFWAVTLSAHAPVESPAIRHKVFVEVLAFSTRLVELKFQAGDVRCEVSYAALLKDIQQAHAQARIQRALIAPDAAIKESLASVDEEAMPAEEYQATVYSISRKEECPFTDEMFEEFCRATGLESRSLVGSGANLATVVFYFVIFGLLGFGEGATRGERNRVLKDTRLCQQRLGIMIEQFLANPEGFNSLLAEIRQLSRHTFGSLPDPMFVRLLTGKGQ
ncbi:MAG: hypothetical protein WCO56_18725 [Verrucomicrobiota bacterium]